MFKKIVIAVLALIVASFVGCQWDYYLSKHLFEKYCDDGRVGQFIYEYVALPDEYFEPLPTDWVHISDYEHDAYFEFGDRPEITAFDGKEGSYKKGRHYRFNGGYRINKARFEQDYIFEIYKEIEINSIGPIVEVQTAVVRKSDKKMLGKSVSLKNYKGWVAGEMRKGFGSSAETCPSGRDENDVPYFYKNHDLLVKTIFNVKNNLQGAFK